MQPLDRVLRAFAGRIHAVSVCVIQDGWRLTFPAFDALAIHFVLTGSGCVRIGDGPWRPFGPGSMIIVPPRRAQALGEAGPQGRESLGSEHCAPFADGLVAFTAGEGRRDTLMACGSMTVLEGQALGLTDLMAGAPVETFGEAEPGRHAFGRMLAEVTQPGLGTQAMLEALMQQCLILLLRRRMGRGEWALPPAMLGHHRLTRAVLAILENPAGPHSVESLAAAAGMGRTAFATAFSQAFRQGPVEFVQWARLQAAARLLATTDLPVKVVAASVGYASRSQFSHAFAALFGADPSRYRAMAHQGDGA